MSLRYRGGPEVLKGVDLELEPGHSVVVAGSNGSGKSTLLRVAAGCVRPTAGTVTDRPRSVGYVPDRFPSQLRMPAASYLRHMAALHRTDADVASRRAAALTDELGFSGGLSTPMAQLSKGNAQKIALAQALCSGARLLVLDEPWSGLDPNAVPVLTHHISAAAADGATVLITDHTGTARGIARGRLLRLDDGRLLEEDSHQETQSQSGETVRIVLLHHRPAQLAAQLGDAHVIDTGRDRVTVDVPPGRSDALFHAALGWGASIHSVHRLPTATPNPNPSGFHRARHNR
ncbi:MAG: ATP-binding cassette domain-containing protein [Pseudonocardiaceae bacterium]